MAPKHMKEAGLTEGHRLARPLPIDKLAVPGEVNLEAKAWITWKWTKADKTVDPDGLLDAVRGVTRSTDALRVARRFGPLGFCTVHGLPLGHRPLSRFIPGTARLAHLWCRPDGATGKGEEPATYREPMASWKEVGTVVNNVLEIVARLDTCTEKQWPELRPFWMEISTVVGAWQERAYRAVAGDDQGFSSYTRGFASPSNMPPIKDQRANIEEILNDMLDLGGVRAVANMTSPEYPSLLLAPRGAIGYREHAGQLAPHGCFGTVAYQLAAAAGRTGGSVHCDYPGCPKWVPTGGRKPRADRYRFCEDHAKNGPSYMRKNFGSKKSRADKETP